MVTPLDAKAPVTPQIEDVQARPDTRNIAINKVGIKEIRHPVRVSDRSGHEQHTIATFGMYVELPHHFKGTHMSRFVEILNGHEHEISVRTFRMMLHDISERLDAETGRPYFAQQRLGIVGPGVGQGGFGLGTHAGYWAYDLSIVDGSLFPDTPHPSSNLAGYPSFGQTVRMPVSGTVYSTVDGNPDLPPPGR